MQLLLHTIDVGHGDAILLQWDEADGKRHVLVDGGAQDQETTANLARYLESAGAATLDLVVATHIDDDHIGGLVNLLNPAGPWATRFTVRRFWGTNPTWVRSLEQALVAVAEVAGRAAAPSPALPSEVNLLSVNQQRTLQGYLQARGIPQDYPTAGQDPGAALGFHRLGLRVMGPAPKQTQTALADLEAGARSLSGDLARRAPQDEAARRAVQAQVTAMSVGILTVTNNQSILLRLTYGGHTMILPGDAETQEWSGAIQTAGAATLSADVLKLAHHGSRNGTPAIAAQSVRPQYGVISVGNKFNLPDAEPFRLLRAARPGARLFSTRYCSHVILEVPDEAAAPLVIVKPDVAQRCSHCQFWQESACHLEAELEATPPKDEPAQPPVNPPANPPVTQPTGCLPGFLAPGNQRSRESAIRNPQSKIPAPQSEIQNPKSEIAVIGGGIAGLTAAYELGKQGYRVTVYEKWPEVGGQAGTFPVGGARLERFYHHLFTSDQHIVDLIQELGLGDRLEWIPSTVGFFHGGQIYDFVTPGDLLRFSPLSLVDRLRAGIISLYLQRQANGLQYEQTIAADWIRHYAGPEVYRIIWHPLLRGKFGQMADQVSMTWFWGKMRLRFGSRKGLGRESLGYLRGSFQLLIDELARRIVAQGGKIETSTPVERIMVVDGQAVGVRGMRRQGEARGTAFTAYHDAVIATVPSFTFLQMAPELPEEYAAKLRQIKYQGALVMVLQIRQSLSRIYWLNMSDPQIPFVAAIEQTNFLPPEVYGGKRLLYLSNYLSWDDPLFRASKQEVLAAYLPGLQRIQAAFDASWVEDSWLFSDEAGQPVVTRGYSQIIPSYETPIPGLYLANTTQIYPEDRGMNYSVRLGQRIASLVAEQMAGRYAPITVG